MNLPGMTFAVPFGWIGDEQYLIVGLEKGKEYPKGWRCFFWDARSERASSAVPRRRS